MKVSVSTFRNAGFVNPYIANGSRFYVFENKLYIIVWKVPKEGKRVSESCVLFSSLGTDMWFSKPFAGKAFYLETKNAPLICAIRQEETQWKIQLYNPALDLNKEVVYPYQLQNREYERYLPIPIVASNGDILFYSLYWYETANPITGFLSSLISGGHGWKPKLNSTLDIIPDLLKRDSQDQEFIVHEVIDASLQRVVMNAGTFEMLQKDLQPLKNIAISGGKGDASNLKKWINSNVKLYITDQNAVVTSADSIMTHSRSQSQPAKIPLPKILQKRLTHLSRKIHSDLIVDSTGNVIWATAGPQAAGELFYYDAASKTWQNHSISTSFTRLTNIRLFLNQNDLFMGFWTYPEAFHIVKLNLSEALSGKSIEIGNFARIIN